MGKNFQQNKAFKASLAIRQFSHISPIFLPYAMGEIWENWG